MLWVLFDVLLVWVLLAVGFPLGCWFVLWVFVVVVGFGWVFSLFSFVGVADLVFWAFAVLGVPVTLWGVLVWPQLAVGCGLVWCLFVSGFGGLASGVGWLVCRSCLGCLLYWWLGWV